MEVWSWGLGVATAVILAAGTSAADSSLEREARGIARAYPSVPQWTTAEASARLAGDAPPVLLDVREAEEFAISRIPGARHVPPGTRPEVVLVAVDRTGPFLLYCSVGQRSSVLAEALRVAGASAVANLSGGIFQWANEGRPLVNATGAVSVVHGYNVRWARLLFPEHRILP